MESAGRGNRRPARVLIVYDTRYGSTKTIAQWIAQGAASKGYVDIAVQNVTEADPHGFDFVVVGSPIYEEHPLPSVVNFLAENRDHLKGKDVALFVVCVDYGAMPREELVHRYAADLRRVAGRVRAIEVFGSYLDIDSSPIPTGSSSRNLLSLWEYRLRKSTSLINRARANSARKLLTFLSDRSC